MKTITPEKIIEIICEYYNLTELQLMQETRKIKIVKPRQILHYLIRKYIKTRIKGSERYKRISLKDTGKVTNQDHATVLNSIKSVDSYIATNQSVRLEIKYLEGLVKSNVNVKEYVKYLYNEKKKINKLIMEAESNNSEVIYKLITA